MLNSLRMLGNRIQDRVFKWVSDDDGDVGLQVLGFITLIKYKHSTIIQFGKNYDRAGKWQGYYGEYDSRNFTQADIDNANDEHKIADRMRNLQTHFR